jgi:hypothetical protein
MVLAFESGDHPLDAWMARALECCADHRATPECKIARNNDPLRGIFASNSDPS